MTVWGATNNLYTIRSLVFLIFLLKSLALLQILHSSNGQRLYRRFPTTLLKEQS